MLYQSGVIPYKVENNKLQVLLISSNRKKKWVIPKGYIDYNMSPFESAKKEAFEEAGIIGSNETIELGSYSRKKGEKESTVKVFSMKVEEQLEEYPEKDLRRRIWLDVDDAVKLVNNETLKEIIKNLSTLLKIPKSTS